MPPQPKVSSATNANLVGSGEYQSDGISAIYNTGVIETDTCGNPPDSKIRSVNHGIDHQHQCCVPERTT